MAYPQFMGPRKHRLYRGHRAKSLNITEEELRTAMKSFLMGMIIIRLFAKSFYKVGMAFGMAMFGIFVLRRKAADVFDQSKPFETSDSWVLITPLGIPLVTTVTYITIFAFIMRLS
ncbi:hypothetical protein BGX23_002237 [Mortierella sp. AD031]|nr:hypothetical protein BGX23_002237 [Mortierella sp. AD031]KAG0199269.1 hypothetical protein BGX33_011753 [Mortierella sp. NVP41]